MEAVMAWNCYPDNLNTTDPRSPEYPHHDRDEAEAAIDSAHEELRGAVGDVCLAASEWEDLFVREKEQQEAAELAPHIAALATDFPACLERGANPTGLTIAGELLDIALRLMKCRLTTRSRHMHGDILNHVLLLRGYVTAIEQEEGRGK
jgi:hypothetical protein